MMDIIDIARVCHEANRAYCQTLLDFSQEIWGESPKWQVDSAIHGVQYHLDNPDSKAEDSHNSWLAEKKADGWVYGETKDADVKTHPCMVPFEDLPKEQRAKDHLFLSIVRALEPFLE
jgi:hypothetical protein